MGGGHWIPDYALIRILLNLIYWKWILRIEYTVTREGLWVLFLFLFYSFVFFKSSLISETVIKNLTVKHSQILNINHFPFCVTKFSLLSLLKFCLLFPTSFLLSVHAAAIIVFGLLCLSSPYYFEDRVNPSFQFMGLLSLNFFVIFVGCIICWHIFILKCSFILKRKVVGLKMIGYITLMLLSLPNIGYLK